MTVVVACHGTAAMAHMSGLARLAAARKIGMHLGDKHNNSCHLEPMLHEF